MKPIQILGISCSTRMIGTAVFKTRDLVDYAITLHKQQWSPEKKETLLAEIQASIKIYSITDIALAIPHAYYQTSACKELIAGIEALAQRNGIALTTYSIAEIYTAFANQAKPTRASLIRRMTMFYEDLERYESKEMHNKHKYYIKLFEAVAVGSVHVLKVQETQD